MLNYISDHFYIIFFGGLIGLIYFYTKIEDKHFLVCQKIEEICSSVRTKIQNSEENTFISEVTYFLNHADKKEFLSESDTRHVNKTNVGYYAENTIKLYLIKRASYTIESLSEYNYIKIKQDVYNITEFIDAFVAYEAHNLDLKDKVILTSLSKNLKDKLASFL